MIIERTFDPALLGEEWVIEAAKAWPEASDGLVPADPEVVVAALRVPCRQGRAMSQWLLERAGSDKAAELVVLFALEGLVRSTSGAWVRNRTTRSEWEGRCVTAAWLAVVATAGRCRPWPMWRLRQVFFAELNERPAPTGELLVDEPVTTPVAEEADDLVVALGRVLSAAARDGVISIDDAQVIWLTRGAGWRGNELAALQGCRPASLRKRRERAEQRLIQRGLSGPVLVEAA